MFLTLYSPTVAGMDFLASKISASQQLVLMQAIHHHLKLHKFVYLKMDRLEKVLSLGTTFQLSTIFQQQ